MNLGETRDGDAIPMAKCPQCDRTLEFKVNGVAEWECTCPSCTEAWEDDEGMVRSLGPIGNGKTLWEAFEACADSLGYDPNELIVDEVHV